MGGDGFVGGADFIQQRGEAAVGNREFGLQGRIVLAIGDEAAVVVAGGEKQIATDVFSTGDACGSITRPAGSIAAAPFGAAEATSGGICVVVGTVGPWRSAHCTPSLVTRAAATWPTSPRRREVVTTTVEPTGRP
jgi:hypothetical protein